MFYFLIIFTPMFKSYKYRIEPTKSQEEILTQYFGACRWIYNRQLNRRIEAYQTTKTKIGANDLIKEITFLKKQEELSWLSVTPVQCLQGAIRNMDSAFTKFFRQKTGFPNFKSKNDLKQSVQFFTNFNIDFEKKLIKIPKIDELIKCRIDRTFEGKIRNVTLSRTPTKKYFVSILVDNNMALPNKAPIQESTAIGIDVGIKDFAVLSDGEKIANPHHYRDSEKRLKCLQRRLAKKQKGSKRRNKAKLSVAKCHEKIANQRKDFLHKLTTKIVAENQSIVIEDLAVDNMLKNHCLSKAISSVAWSEFFRQLQYKSDWNGKNLIRIGRFEPSSKMCTCGVINKELKLSDRNWTCKSCNTTHDRDLLAANNIKRFGLTFQNLVSYSPAESGGEHVELLLFGRAEKREDKLLKNSKLFHGRS